MPPRVLGAVGYTRSRAFCHLLINLSGVYGEPHGLSIVQNAWRTAGRGVFVWRTE